MDKTHEMEDKAWAESVRAKYQAFMADEDNNGYNTTLHQEILDNWKANSPKRWAKLQKWNLAEEQAILCQVAMWEMSDNLEKAGYPYTDAREVAERECLMLTPESEMEPDPYGEDAVENRRWREEVRLGLREPPVDESDSQDKEPTMASLLADFQQELEKGRKMLRQYDLDKADREENATRTDGSMVQTIDPRQM